MNKTQLGVGLSAPLQNLSHPIQVGEVLGLCGPHGSQWQFAWRLPLVRTPRPHTLLLASEYAWCSDCPGPPVWVVLPWPDAAEAAAALGSPC